MKTKIRLVLLLAVLLCVSGCKPGTESKETTPVESRAEVFEKTFGDFTTQDISGNPADSSVFKDYKLTMVNIWATYCSPCIREMPGLANLNKKYADKGFRVVGIVTDVCNSAFQPTPSKMETAGDIIELTGADYLHLIPSRSLVIAHLSQCASVPETVFVDSEGNRVAEIYAGSRAEEEWDVIIKDLLEKAE